MDNPVALHGSFYVNSLLLPLQYHGVCHLLRLSAFQVALILMLGMSFSVFVCSRVFGYETPPAGVFIRSVHECCIELLVITVREMYYHRK